MTTSERILQSKENIKLSDSMNVTYELLKMLDDFDDRKNDATYLQMILVRIVSSNESFFKETFASILDYKDKYATNSKNLLKKTGVKIDLDDFIHVTKKTYSIGDLISYSLTYSSIDTILKNYEEITEISIYKELDSADTLLQGQDLDTNLISLERPFDKGRMLRNIKEAYELRNVICHDFLSTSHKLSFDCNRLKDYLLDTGLLQECIIFISAKLIYNDIPLETQERLDLFNGLILERETELAELYSEVEATFQSQEQHDNFNQNKKLFQSFIDNDSKNFGAWFWNDDSPFQEMIPEHKVKLLDQRIEKLREERKQSS